jgi:UDP-2-acetamido-3-amino-2,3-dideoxy-glucuronate N-acetyltransferase
VIRRGATVGAAAVVLPSVVVGEWAMVAAGAVVHRDVEPYTLVAGNPARAVGFVCRCGQRLGDDLTCACGLAYVDGPTGLTPSGHPYDARSADL